MNKLLIAKEQQRLDTGLKEIALAGSEDRLQEVVELWPGILTGDAEDRVRQHYQAAVTEGQRHFAASILQTIQFVRQGDFSGAWSIRESVIRTFWQETIAPRMREFDAARQGRDWPEVVRVGGELLDVFPPGTYSEVEVHVAHFVAVALLHDEGPNRDESVDRAIDLGQFALSILDAVPDIDTPQLRIPVVSNLGSAFGFRPRGDSAWNYEQSLAYLTEAVNLSQEAGDRDSWAMAQTNLAGTLTTRGNPGDYDQARRHLALALTHRSRRRNLRDWAFSQLQLGLTYSRDDSGDGAVNIREAITHFSNARDAAQACGDVPLRAQAEHNLAVERLALARTPDTKPADRSMLLGRAEESALASARLSDSDVSPVRYGHAWLMIGKIRAARWDRRAAIDAFTTVLSALSVETAPSELREASRLLLELAEAEGDLTLAGDAAARLVEAAAAVISARSRAEDRMSEHRGRSTTDFRFAANALVRAKRLDEAVTALELGRTRELGLPTLGEGIDLDMLAHLDPGLRDDVLNVSASLREDILAVDGDSVSDRAEQFARLRTALRRTPTFEKALDAPTLEEISRVAQPHRPLVYVGSAPTGSFAIIVDGDGRGAVGLDAIHASDCDSEKIAHAAFGLDANGNQVTPAPYLAAQASNPDLLDPAIADLSPLLGEKLLRPLAASLAARGASGLTLVPTGILGLMPLHAISWSECAGTARSLVDDFDVTIAASARLQIACMQRASERAADPVRFVGIANPLPNPRPLEYAELELQSVQRFVPSEHTRLLTGEAATKKRVSEALPSATHVHLACHGKGRLFDPLFSAALSLSNDEELSALEIARLHMTARLVVASACETGVPQDYHAVDESLGLASAFIAAGAAGVVSTLWSVEDYPTALIMTKFYEALFAHNSPPAIALREAQLWMRDADEAAIDAYVSTHAPLRRLRTRRSSEGGSNGAAFFREPSCWAAFVFSGA